SAEGISSVAELESQIDEFDRPGNKYLATFGAAVMDDVRREVNLRIAWRRCRTSPGRCLGCGTADIFPISEDESLDPLSGHRFRKRGGSFASMVFHAVTRVSAEGVILYTNAAGVKDAASRFLAEWKGARDKGIAL